MKLLILGVLVAGAAIQGAEIETPLSASDKVTTRFGRLVDPLTFVWSAAGAGIGQWRDSPPEWGQGAKGLARRFAASEAYKLTQNSLALGFDTALGSIQDSIHPMIAESGRAFVARLAKPFSPTKIQAAGCSIFRKWAAVMALPLLRIPGFRLIRAAE